MEAKVQYNCVVVIPVYRVPTLIEQCSFKQGLNVLRNYDIVIVTNKSVDLTKFDDISKQCGKSYSKELFDEKFFKGVKGYNALCLSKEFYQRFSDKYVYMLIYQLDAWVFRDELQAWCNKGYDYVGSPFFVSPDKGEHYIEVFNGVGNGGLSLRNIKYCLSVLSIPKFLPYMTLKKEYSIWKTDYKYAYIPRFVKWLRFVKIPFKALGVKNTLYSLFKRANEDYIFSDYAYGSHYLKPKLPDEKLAAIFAFELHPSLLYREMGDKLPFGCHAFEKYEYESFWSSYIPQDIHLPNIMALKTPFSLMNSFIARYGDKILKQFNDLNAVTVFCSEQIPQFGGMAQDDSPYMEMPVKGNKASFTIYRNEKLCNEMGLTVDEQHVLIAHEFGHIIHSLQGKATNGLPEECFADEVAVKIVGRDKTLSALNKIKSYIESHPSVPEDLAFLAPETNSDPTAMIDARIQKI